MTDFSKKEISKGQIQISDDVITIIAGTACMEIEGVAGMSGTIVSGISEILGKKNVYKGIKLHITEDDVKVNIDIAVKFGFKIHDVAEKVQEKVAAAIETMTGLNVSEVNVSVSSVIVEKQKETLETDI